jgi:sec-independent protein translocase protein TatA
METMIILFSFGMPEILLIALVVLLLFGGAKIPELMRGIGKGVSEFKKGVRDVENEIKNTDTDTKEEDKKA